jgi:autotransporter-associated beta strand protein
MEKSNFCRTAIALWFLTLLPVTGHLQAATLYWDADGNAIGNSTDGTSLGGSGNWDTTTTSWWNGAASTAWPDTDADHAIFTAAFSPGTPVLNTVTLSSDLTAHMVSFLRSGYTLTGGELVLAGATPTLHATLGDSAMISSLIGGTEGLTMTGGGTIRLTNNTNTYTGITSIANGTLIISNQGALGGSSGAVVVTDGNATPSNAATIGFSGGSLFLDGSAAGFTFSRDLELSGAGPVGGRGAALLSIGDNTLSGIVNAAVSSLTPATFKNTRLISANGTLTLSGTLNVGGTPGTTVTSLGGINQAGASLYNFTGVLAGTGTLEKSGGGTLFLTPSDTSGFAGRLRVSSSAASGQSTVRIGSLNDGAGTTSIFGTANSTTTSAPIDMNGGVLEIRSDSSLNFGKNLYQRASSTLFVGPAVGGAGVNGTVAFGSMAFEDNITNTFNSRNGYGVSFTTAPVVGSTAGDNNSTITNSMAGTLSFTGNFWSNANNTGSRTMTIGGNGNTVINGNVIASSASFNHNLTKTGTGALTITGTGSTLDGNVSVQGTLIITDFRSIGNNTSSITLGSATTTSGHLVIGTSTPASEEGLVTSRPIIFNNTTTTAVSSIIANQAGLNPVVLNGAITKPNATSFNIILGGTNTADNVLNSAIPLSGTGGVTKIGSGTWVLAGQNAYTGTTSLVNGTLKLQANADNIPVLGSSNAISFTNSNVFAGATLEFAGAAGTNNSLSLGPLSYASGANTIKVTPGLGGTASLTFSDISTTGASTINVVGADFINNQVIFTQVNASAGSNGIITRSIYWNGADFAYREGGVLRAPEYGVDGGTVTSDSGLASGHNQITGSFATGSISISTLKIAGSQALTINDGATLTLSSGGLLATGGISSITGGTVALGSQVLVVRVNAPEDVLTIHSLITGTGGLTKAGEGALILTGANTRTGTVNLDEGVLRLAPGAVLSGANAALTLRQSAVFDMNGVSTGNSVGSFNNAGVVTNSSGDAVTLTVGNNNGTGTSFGIIQETNGVINVTKVGTGAQLWLGQSTYTGVTTIGSTGLVTVDFLADIGEASGIGRGDSTSDATNAASLVFNGSTGGLDYAGNIRDVNLILGARSASTDRLFTLSGSGATLSSTAANFNAIVWRNTGAIVHGTDADRTLTFTGSSQGDNTFNPQITDSTGFATSVTKTGTGIWRLGNSSNTYSGTTTITQGILMATDGQGLSSNSNLLFDGGTLYSQGTLTRNIGADAGQMQFAAPADANHAEFIGGFLGGDSKLTVSWSGTPVWGSTAGFISERDGLILNGSQARAQGATGSIALSEVEITGDFSLGIASATGKTIAVTTANSSATATVTTGDTSGLVVGQSITGPNIASGAYIVSINSATQFTMSANASAATATNRDLIANNLRTIRVDDNANTGADFATISGVISGGDSVTGLRKVGSGTLKLTGANTYEGETNVNQGTLVVTSLGLSGSAGTSSVGAVTVDAFGNANAVTLGNGGTGGGLLQYIGAGETSDRKIRLNSTTGSNQIHADGSGALILTNVANDLVAGAKTLYLRGTNAAGNMITSQLSDNGGTLGVAVDSSATWILTNENNNYTGTTTAGSGALGIGHDSALGSGTFVVSNANVFAYGADRTIANTLQLNSGTTHGFIGNHSLIFTSTVAFAASTSSSNFTNNSLAAGKTLTFNAGVTANSITATRNWQFDGPGETIINGDFTTSTAFGVNVIKTGDGILTLGTSGANSNWNQAGNALDLDRGTLKFTADNAIPTASASNGGLTISPELLDVDTATADTATVDFNGTTQTVNAITATSNGILVLDNTSANAATFRFGANDSAVNFGSGVGSYTVQNTGAGALSLVKLGNTTATFISGITLAHKGITASEGGGVFTIASPVTATTGLRVVEGSALILSGGLPNGHLVTSIEVGGGSTLSLLDGAGSQFSNLTTLNLGNTGAGAVTLNLNVGDKDTNLDRLNTDTLTLLTGGILNLGQTIIFNMNDAGLNAHQTYTLLNLVDGGLDAFGVANLLQGATPGGFDSFTWFVDDHVVQLTTGNLIVGDLYWLGTTDTTWNASADNWSLNKDGTGLPSSIPGQGTRVIFAYDGVGAAELTTTLEQNIKINALVFEAGATTPSSVTINPGAVGTSRLEIAPSSAANGIAITAGGPAAVTIGANLKLGADQTWNVADPNSTLTISGALFGEANVTKTGSGKVILTQAADPTFNGGQTSAFNIAGGNLEITNLSALGTLANSNLASIDVSGGGFYYNNATAGTVVNALTLSGGTLSAGGATQTYSGTVNVSGNSFINLADSNGPSTNTARSITLSGVVSGAGSLTVSSNTTTLVGGNPEGGTLTISNADSTWSGDLILTSGSVDITAAASATVTPGDITFDGFGRLIVRGLNGQVINRADELTFTAGAIGEYLLDNSSAVLADDFVVNQNGQVNIGSGGTGASARFTLSDAATQLNITGSVILGGDSSISVDGGDADSFTTISGVISDGGSGYSLAINDDAGGWAVSNNNIRLTGLNTFTGDVSVAEGVLEFTTVSDIGGPASSLGQGDEIRMSGGTLRFVGDTVSQTTNRQVITSTSNSVLSLGGTNGAKMTYTGAITVGVTSSGSRLTLTGDAGSEGAITGGFTMTGTDADAVVSGGTWTLSGAQNTVADNMTVQGTSTVLNLNDTSVLRFLAGAASGDIYINDGSTVNIGADNAIDMTIAYRLFIGQTAGGAAGILNLGAFNLSSGRFILGERAADRKGIVNGTTGVLTVVGGDIDLYEGEINANFASTGSTALEKFGPGTVTFRGDNSGLASTGATVLNEGTLVLDYTLSNTTKVREASQLEMRGMDLLLIGNASAATSQTVASFNLDSTASDDSSGASRITLQPGAGQEIVLNLGEITRTATNRDGTIRFVLPTGVQSATNGFTTSTGLHGSGLLGSSTSSGYATVEDGVGTWFATKSGSNIVGLVSTAKNDVTTWLTADHITDTAGGFSGALGATAINSLRFDAATGSDLLLAPAGSLNIASGGILVTDQVTGSGSSILGGRLASGTSELIITQDSSQVFEISASIGTNHAFTKSGAGTVLLSGDNNFTDETDVLEGTLILAGGNAIGNNSLLSLAINRDTLVVLTADETIGRLNGGKRATNSEYGTVAVGSHTLTLNQSGGTTTFAGFFTGTGGIVFSETSVSTLNMQNNSSGFTGTVVINGGLFQLSNIGRNDASSFTINGNGMMLIDNTGSTVSTTRILDSTPIILNSAAGGGANIRGLWVRNTDSNASRFETIGDLVFNSGASYLTGEANDAGASENARAGIIASTFVRNDNATFSVRGRNLGTTLQHHNQFRLATANEAAFIAGLVGGGDSSGVTLSILPWAIGETHNNTTSAGTNMGNSLVTYVAGQGLRPLDLVAGYAGYATAGDTNNTRESLSASLTGLAGRTLNSLVINNEALGALDFTGLGAGQLLTNTSGAFLFTLTGGANDTAYSTVLSGFDSGIAVGGTEYIFHVVNPSAEATTPRLVVTVASPLSTAADITKSGRGTLVLSGVNLAGGDANKTTLNEGVLEISSLSNIGGASGGLVFAGGTLRLGPGFSDDLSLRDIRFLTGGGTIDTNGTDLILSASLGSGVGGFTKVGDGNLILQAAATYTGSTTIAGGGIAVGANQAIGSGNLNIIGGGSLDLGTSEITVALVSTSGASPVINGTGVITSTQGFVFSHTGDTTLSASLAGAGGLFKNQSNVLTLDGASTYSGITEVQNGTLAIGSISSIGAGPSALGNPVSIENGIIRMGLTTGGTTLRYTGAGHSSDRLVGLQGTTGGVTLSADGTGAFQMGGAVMLRAGTKTLTLRGTSDAVIENTLGRVDDGLIGGLSISKVDANTWVLTAANSYSGITQIDNGTLRIGVNDALPTGTTVRLGSGATAGTLDANGFDQTIASLLSQTNSASLTNQLIIDSGNTLTVTGAVTLGSTAATSTTLFSATGGGAFVNNNDGGIFQVGGSTSSYNAATADFSGLGSLTVDLGATGTMRVGDNTSATGTTGGASTLILAESNVITAALLQISGLQSQTLQTLRLGSGTNQLNVDVLSVGSNWRGSGTVNFASGTGSMVLRAADGIGRAEVRMAAHAIATNANNVNTINFSGHDADLLISTLTLVDRSASGTASGPDNQSAGYATFSFDQGILDALSVIIARRTGSGSGDGEATLNLGGGTVQINALTMAVNTSAGGVVSGALNISGGNVTIGTGAGAAINMANAGAGRTVTSTIDLTGGTVAVTGNIIRQGGAGTENATITLNGSSMDMNGHNIGSAAATIAFNAQSGTLRNLGELNGGADLVKTTAGVLVLEGVNQHTGRTVINEGVLSISSQDQLGLAPASFIADHLLLDGGTLRTTATLALDDANRGITVGAGGGTFETAASTTLTVGSVITGGGALSKQGVGTLIFNAVNTHTGTTTVNAGVLGGSGTVGGNLMVADGGTLAPGSSAGMFTVSGELTVSSGGTLLMELGGSTFNAAAVVQAEMNANGNLSGLAGSIPPEWENYQAGVTEHDHILVNGASAPVVDGTLRFGPLLGAYNPGYGDVFDLLDWSFAGNISGATSFDFSAVMLDAGLGFNTDLFARHGLIVVVPEPSRALFLMLGLLGLLLRRRRR